MAAEVKYNSGPGLVSVTDEARGLARGDAVLWVRVGKSDTLRPVVLTNQQLIRLAHNCLDILNRRLG
jgi:hypothetical protein